MVLLSEGQKHLCVFIFVSNTMPMAYVMPNVLKSVYYALKLFGPGIRPNRDNLFGQLSKGATETPEKLLQQKLMPYPSANFSIISPKQSAGNLATMSFATTYHDFYRIVI